MATTSSQVEVYGGSDQGAITTLAATAPDGATVTGGGVAEVNEDGSVPSETNGLYITGSQPTADGTGWQGNFYNGNGPGMDTYAAVYVMYTPGD